MTIHRLLQNMPIGPEEIGRLVKAYELTLHDLQLPNHDNPMTRMIAKTIIEIGQTGIRDPAQISKLAMRKLSSDRES